MRKNISTNTISERRVGYSRAVVVGNRVVITGTTSVSEDGMVVGETLSEQVEYVFEKILGVLRGAGFLKKDVIMIRVYLVAMDKITEFDEVFKKYFFDVKPCCTLVGISSLFDKKVLVEIECEAQKGDSRS